MTFFCLCFFFEFGVKSFYCFIYRFTDSRSEEFAYFLSKVVWFQNKHSARMKSTTLDEPKSVDGSAAGRGNITNQKSKSNSLSFVFESGLLRHSTVKFWKFQQSSELYLNSSLYLAFKIAIWNLWRRRNKALQRKQNINNKLQQTKSSFLKLI